jgi:ribosomal protein L7Ae-like RNA K-turn-binding protein
MNKKKFLSLLGFAQRAGKISSGTIAARTSIVKGKALLVIFAKDISSSTEKEFMEIPEIKKTKVLKFCDKQELGNAIGKSERSIIVVEDENFAFNLMQLIEGSMGD